MEGIISITRGQFAGTQVETGECFTIGRHSSNLLRLSGSSVSRRHCQITRTSDGFVIEDLGSLTGTYVNGHRISQSAQVKDGFRFRVGDTEFLFSLAEDAASMFQTGAWREPKPDRATSESNPFLGEMLTVPLQDVHVSHDQAEDRTVEISDQEARLRTVLELNQLLFGSPPSESKFGSLCELLISLFGAQRASVLKTNPGKNSELAFDLSALRTRRCPSDSSDLCQRTIAHAMRAEAGVLTREALPPPETEAPDRAHSEQSRSVMCAPIVLEGAVWGILYVDSVADRNPFSHADLRLLTTTSAAFSTTLRAHTHQPAQSSLLLDCLRKLTLLAERKIHADPELHLRRIEQLTERLTEELELDPAYAVQIRKAAGLHDVGLIAVPEHSLRETDALLPEDLQVNQGHCQAGADLIPSTDDPALAVAKRLILSHHERYDGTGYPNKLGGTKIPLEGRIIAVVDAYVSLTEPRPHRRALGIGEALAVLEAGRATQFDPKVLDGFVRCVGYAEDDRALSRNESSGVRAAPIGGSAEAPNK
jgi:pSer/pThr/pTyr-binding forkhead associated (FHA) protein/GAF domain-containing protein